MSAFLRDAARHLDREEGLISLIGVGRMRGTPAGEIQAGDRLMWNYGSVYEVISVRDASPQFVEIAERDTSKPGTRFYTRRLRKTRLVVLAKPGEKFRRAIR